MICSFCQHEFDDNLTECPYCHRVVEKDAKSLTVEERESFGGDTIELDGTVHEGSRQSWGDDSAREGEYQETYGEGPYERADGKDPETGRGNRGFKVHQFNLGGLGGILFWAVLLIVIVCLIFFLLPAFFMFALVAAAVFFLYRLFASFFA